MQIKHSDILKESTGILVHGVNAQGVMGSGIAKLIRDKYPQVYTDYMRMYKFNGNQLMLGEVIKTDISDKLKIVSGVTQKFYGRDKNFIYLDYAALEKVFVQVNDYAKETSLPVIFPLVGCGLANGDKDTVLKIINDTLDNDIQRTLFLI